MRLLDLFSGIGGFSLAAESVGIETVAFCECEPYPQSVLRRHWPDVPIFDDVKELTADALADARCYGRSTRWEGGRPAGLASTEGETDGGTRSESSLPVEHSRQGLIITAGFPCQDISYAGKGAGLDGERSGLFFEVARLTDELRPDYLLLENVAALLTRGLDAVLGTLASLGYDALWACIPACAVGAPHRRDRIWIVAAPEGTPLTPIYERVLAGLTPFGDDRWPTATASDSWANEMDRSGMVGMHNVGLGTAVRSGAQWPTPQAFDRVECVRSKEQRDDTQGGCSNLREVAHDYDNSPGSLNPDWVESLMGYPMGWTDVSLPTPASDMAEEMHRAYAFVGMWPAGLGAPQHDWEPPRLTTVKENRAARLKALGNSIVPQVARLWLEAISAASSLGGEHENH